MTYQTIDSLRYAIIDQINQKSTAALRTALIKIKLKNNESKDTHE